MNILRHYNEALNHIENNLLHEIDFQQVARIAGCSEYQFRRMFPFLAGMPLGEYIRKRKLSIAVSLLQHGEKVIDVALKLGYETPESFSKAFQAMHGVTPSQVKRDYVHLKAFPPIHFQLTVRGGIEMDYRIVEKEEFRIVGFKKRIILQYEGTNPQMNALVEKLTPAVITELKDLSNIEPKGILNVSTNFAERTTEGSELDQYLGVATTKLAPLGYDILSVEASTWAVFTAIGPFPTALQTTWAKIYSEWLATSGYTLTGGPEILWNESPDTSRPDYKSEIWIPVRSVA